MDEFERQLYAWLAQIPKGHVVTYGQLAHLIGQPAPALLLALCPEKGATISAESSARQTETEYGRPLTADLAYFAAFLQSL